MGLQDPLGDALTSSMAHVNSVSTASPRRLQRARAFLGRCEESAGRPREHRRRRDRRGGPHPKAARRRDRRGVPAHEGVPGPTPAVRERRGRRGGCAAFRRRRRVRAGRRREPSAEGARGAPQPRASRRGGQTALERAVEEDQPRVRRFGDGLAPVGIRARVGVDGGEAGDGQVRHAPARSSTTSRKRTRACTSRPWRRSGYSPKPRRWRLPGNSSASARSPRRGRCGSGSVEIRAGLPSVGDAPPHGRNPPRTRLRRPNRTPREAGSEPRCAVCAT